MPNKENKGRGAIHRLMQDLILIQEKKENTEDKNSADPGRNRLAGKPGCCGCGHERSLSEQIEFYQQKLDGLKRAEKLDAFISHPGLIDNFNPKELAAVTESLKSTLAKFEQRIHHLPHNSEKDSDQFRQELSQIHETLGVLTKNIDYVTEKINTGQALTESPKSAVEIPVEQGVPDTIKEEPESGTKSQGLADKPDIQEHVEVNSSVSTPQQEKKATEEKDHYEKKDKLRLEKVEELKKHLGQVYQMIEKRSAKIPGRVEEVSPPSDGLSTKQTTPTPLPEAVATIPEAGEDKSETERTVEVLKSTMPPLERLSFEQYLRDLRAYDIQNRIFAIRKLGKMRRLELAGILLNAWEKETDNSVRAEILNALIDMDYHDARSVLKKALKRPDPKIVIAALEGLYRFGGKEVEEEFVKALEHSHYSVRRRAGTYLGWMKAEWAIPNIVKLLRDPDIYNRKVGISVLSKFQAKQVIFFLIETLSDPDQGVRETAIKVLTNWTGEDMGYCPQADEMERSKAVCAWRQWWEKSETCDFEFQPKKKTNKVSKKKK